MRIAAGAAGAVAAIVLVGLAYAAVTGLSARGEPGRLETAIARAIRRLAIPGDARRLANPLPSTPAHVSDGLAHFADHCAACHANDGSGDAEMGRNLFPPPPDMRLPVTQDLTDGELFYIIEHGTRFTGMPGWGDGSPESQEASWQLVHFIRRLPSLTGGELERMKGLNPRPPDEIRRQIEEERFLAGESDAAPVTIEKAHGGHE